MTMTSVKNFVENKQRIPFLLVRKRIQRKSSKIRPKLTHACIEAPFDSAQGTAFDSAQGTMPTLFPERSRGVHTFAMEG